MKLSYKQLAVYLSLIMIGGGLGVFGSCYFSSRNNNYRQLTDVTTNLPSNQNTPTYLSNGSEVADLVNVNFVTSAVKQTGPAVVRINATRKVANPIADTFKNSLLRRFFGEDEEPFPEERIERGTGSGFIVSGDGQILTNAHVVADTDTVQVTMKDGRTFKGNVVGVDTTTDIAAVKILGDKLPTVKLGNSQNLIPGEWAIAIGNPLGLDNTVTIGIISATDRTSAQVGVPDKRVSFIQTDAAINPGNSGGPLLNFQGQVIGVNTAIRADAQGLGFAIPIETAARIADELFTKGRVDHPFLGIEMVDLTPDKRKEINKESKLTIKQDTGIFIQRVVENSPANKGGILSGDFIIKINHKSVKTSAQVQKQVDLTSVGEILEIKVKRNGKLYTFKLEPEPYPKNK
ncbi:MAG: trypsin-like peptidase domain-containing protein [Richelia sp.]|nr:trypsin-like peptidase domain-containing protein [Richelia sp.]